MRHRRHSKHNSAPTLAQVFATSRSSSAATSRAIEPKVKALLAAGISETAVRADANNLWTDADRALRYLDALGFRFSALEEPLRAGDFAGMRRMSQALDTRIILDESMLRADQLDEIRADAHRWIANVRVSKLGGLLRSLQFGVAARASGVPIIVGAHVGETSVLTRAALVLASSMRDCVVACEGAFGTHLLEHDVVAPSIMFGQDGIVDAGALRIGTTPGSDWRRAGQHHSSLKRAPEHDADSPLDCVHCGRDDARWMPGADRARHASWGEYPRATICRTNRARRRHSGGRWRGVWSPTFTDHRPRTLRRRYLSASRSPRPS